MRLLLEGLKEMWEGTMWVSETHYRLGFWLGWVSNDQVGHPLDVVRAEPPRGPRDGGTKGVAALGQSHTWPSGHPHSLLRVRKL